MKRSALTLLPILCLILWACPKDDPEPSINDNRVPIPDYLSVSFSNSTYSPNPDDRTLTELPECDGPIIERQKIKFSVRAATKEESPTKQQCGKINNTMGTYFYIREYSAFVMDVSYYSGIKRVTLDVADYCGGSNTVIAAYLYDLDGKLIESKGIKGDETSNWTELRFDKGLSNLKEIRFVNLCEGGIRTLRLYDNL